MGRQRRHRKDLPQRVYERSGTLWFVDRAGRWHRLGRQYAEAMVRYAELLGEPSPIRTLGQALDRYQRDVLPRKAPRTQREQLAQLGRLRAVFGHMALADVTAADVYGYLDRRPPVAGRHEKGLLSHVYTCAIRWGLVEGNPCSEVRAERRRRPPARYLTDAEYAAARARAPAPLGEAMDLAVITGLRLGDVLALRREHCTDEGVQVTIRKTGITVVHEWTPGLRAAVGAAKRLREVASVWLVCRRDGQRYTEAGFKAMWQRWQVSLEAAGVPRFRFHDLRRKAARDAETLHGREYARQLLGHASQEMTGRYVGGVFRVRPVR